MRELSKLVNSSFVRSICHSRDVKISEDAIKQIARGIFDMLNEVIEEIQKDELVVIQRRHIERRL